MHLPLASLPSLLLAATSALALAACVEPAEPILETETAALGASCVLGDGYVIPSGSHHIIYPVSCGSDCRDYPLGGFDYWMFCKNGVLGESDPTLTSDGGNAPYIDGSIYNGYSRCSTRPTATYRQTADRKGCIRR